VIGMTDMTMTQIPYLMNDRTASPWRRRTGVAAVSAMLGIAVVFGPGPVATTRLGAGELVGFATVSAADTITSRDVLAEVPATPDPRS
jgi:hypothetical protein